MDAQKIMFLLNKDENTKLDFKLKLSTETESSKKELAKDISAIANSRGGRGYILFGIEDKTKKIIGINKDDFHEEAIQQIVATRIDPPVPISVDLVDINEATIGIITIYTTEQKPHQIRETGAFHIRRGSTTDIMRKDEIASLLEETGVINHELLPVLKASADDLNKDWLMDYFRKSGLPAIVSNSLLLEVGILVYEKDFTIPHPSFGGLLLFGKAPDIFLPHCIIKIHNSLNKDMPHHFVALGTIMEQLESSSTFIEKCIGSSRDLMDIIEEHLGKAVLYRDYFNINNCVEIYLNNKNIEIINPGASLKNEDTDKEKYIKRNMWLYLKALTLDNNHRYFHKEYTRTLTFKQRRRIKYYNLLSQNMFKVIIPLNI